MNDIHYHTIHRVPALLRISDNRDLETSDHVHDVDRDANREDLGVYIRGGIGYNLVVEVAPCIANLRHEGRRDRDANIHDIRSILLVDLVDCTAHLNLGQDEGTLVAFDLRVLARNNMGPVKAQKPWGLLEATGEYVISPLLSREKPSKVSHPKYCRSRTRR